MSYLIQSKLAGDSDIRARVTACAAQQNIPEPWAWAEKQAWTLSAQPGWVEAYEPVLESGRPGADESAITDEMILSAVLSLM